MAEKKTAVRDKAAWKIMARACMKRMEEERVFPRVAEAGEEFSGNCQGVKLSALACQKPEEGREPGAGLLEAAAGAMERLSRNRLDEERVFPRAQETLGEFAGNCQGLRVSLERPGGTEAAGRAGGSLAGQVFDALRSRRRDEERVFPFDAGLESEFSGNCQGLRIRAPRP